MLDRSNELTAWDRDHFFHPSTHMGTHARGETPTRVMAGGEGVTIWDVDGRKSIDAFAGLYCVNVGYGRQKIADAIASQAKNLAYYHAYVGHGTEASITLSKMIIDRAPKGMSRVYFGLSGSDANETNIKLIWYYNNVLGRPEKKKIISRWRGYHGSGVMTGSLTGLDLFHNAFDLPRAPILHTEAPYYFRRADRSMKRGAVLAVLRRQAGGNDPRRRSGHCRRLHRRADPRHRRHRAAARRLLGEDPGCAGEIRRAAGRRRGGDRLRPAGHDVRLRPLRHQARPHHHRQGPDLRLCAAVGRHRLGQGVAGAGRKVPTSSAASATAGPIRRIRSAWQPASPISNSSTRWTW